MAQNPRTIDPGDAQDERVAALPLTAAYTFAYLPTVLDDEGRAKDQPAVFNGHLWPLRADAHPTAAMADDIAELVAAGLLCRYTVDGHDYVHDPRWRRRQKIHRPARSELPRCPAHDSPFDDIAATLGRVPEQFSTAVGNAATFIDRGRIGGAVARVVEDATFPVDPGKAASYGQRIREFLAGEQAGQGDESERGAADAEAADTEGTEVEVEVERTVTVERDAGRDTSDQEAEPERERPPTPADVWRNATDDPTDQPTAQPTDRRTDMP